MTGSLELPVGHFEGVEVLLVSVEDVEVCESQAKIMVWATNPLGKRQLSAAAEAESAWRALAPPAPTLGE